MKRFLIIVIFGLMVFIGCKKKSNPPEKPATPSGPSSGSINVVYSFTSLAEDPDGDSVAIRFAWGDGNTSDWSPFVKSGDSVSMSHSWADSGTYSIKAQAKDNKGATSDWSEAHSIHIIRNQPPNTPGVPSGPSTGCKDSSYIFTAITTNPDNDGVCYRFAWGDGDTSDWSPWVPSGFPTSLVHCWLRGGTYQVKAQAKDVN